MGAFRDWLDEQRSGNLEEELDAEIALLVATVHQLGKKGSLVLTIGVEPKGRTVVVDDKVKTNLPKADRYSEIFFPDEQGVLHREDPAQAKLDFGAVVHLEKGPTGVLRAVDTDTGEIINPQGAAQ